MEVKAALEDPDSVFFKIKANENTLGVLCRVQYTGTLFGEVGMGDSLGPSSHGVAPTRYHYYIHYVLRVWGVGFSSEFLATALTVHIPWFLLKCNENVSGRFRNYQYIINISNGSRK